MAQEDPKLTNNEGEPLAPLRHVNKYRSDYLQVQIAIIFLQLAVLASLLLLAAVQLFNRPPTIHFYENPKGQIITPMPLNEPGISNAALSNWLIEGIMAGFHFNVVTVDRTYEDLLDYFNKSALEEYKKSLESTGILPAVKDMRMIVDGHATGAPEVLNEGLVKGRYTWHLKVPIEINVRNERLRFAVSGHIEVLVARVPELVAPMGIVVEKYNLVATGLENYRERVGITP